MKLKNCEILPGVIIDVNDPKKLGRVKATVPTLFDDSVMEKEGLPWIYPWPMFGYQQFSKMMVGSKIWVLTDETNHNGFFYFPLFEMNEDTRGIIDDYDNPEVLVCRTMGTNSVKIYYNDGDGIKLCVGDSTEINITPDTSIICKAGNGQVIIKGDHVYVGDGEEGEPAVFGNKLVDLLSQLATDLSTLGTTAAPNPYTGHLGAPFNTASSNISSKVKDILCKNTNVD